MFLVEQRISVSFAKVDLASGNQLEPEFLLRNPVGQVPVLELADGTCLAESVTICRYLEQCQGCPKSLFGDSPLEVARVDMWQRRVEQGLLLPAIALGHHSAPLFRKRVQQCQEVAALQRARIRSFWPVLEHGLSERCYLALERFSYADITGLCAVEVAALFHEPPPPDMKRILAWHELLSARPSASVMRYGRWR